VIDGSGAMLAMMDGPDEPIRPGESTQATIKALYEPNVSYHELVEGARFEILEGQNVVGYGNVVHRLS
jgi:hypothetical protein